MPRMLSLLLCTVAAFAADDPWTKVKELKSGTEIRIYKRGASAPVTGKIDEAREENLSVVIKNEQMTIGKDQIERLDYRPQAGSKMATETRSKIENPDTRPPVGMNHGPAVPKASSSSNVSFGSKPDFRTIYRRPIEKK
jgi:hypothetical protein